MRKIQSRFLLICLLISTVSLLIMTLISVMVSYRMTVKRTSEEIAVNLQMASNILDDQALEMETLARNILNDSIICSYLKKGINQDKSLNQEVLQTKLQNAEDVRQITE